MNNKNILTLSVIGGDKRSLEMATMLCHSGHSVVLFGFNQDATSPYGFACARTLEQAIATASSVILPIPCSTDDESIYTPLYNGTIYFRDLLDKMNPKQSLFAGRMCPSFSRLLHEKNILYFDYASREEFSVLNAIPTAEGAIEIAMRELNVTLHGASCLVLGFGRIGKVLAKDLSGLGASVTIAARKPTDIAWIKSYGYHATSFSALDKNKTKFQVIFNTAPATVIDKPLLSTLQNNCLIIDLASKPGGANASFG